jgi:hypothetical protein
VFQEPATFPATGALINLVAFHLESSRQDRKVLFGKDVQPSHLQNLRITQRDALSRVIGIAVGTVWQEKIEGTLSIID